MPPRSQRKDRRADNKGRIEPIWLDETVQPWDRQPNEGDKAWECFQLYRDALQPGGIGKRTQRAVSERVYAGSSQGMRAKKSIGDWSVKFRWIERAEAFDRNLDAIRQESFRAEAKRDGEQALALYRAMRAKAGQALIALPANALSPGELTRMADLAIIGIRREAGLATEISSTEKDTAFADWLQRGGDPDLEEEEDNARNPPTGS